MFFTAKISYEFQQIINYNLRFFKRFITLQSVITQILSALKPFYNDIISDSDCEPQLNITAKTVMIAVK